MSIPTITKNLSRKRVAYLFAFGWSFHFDCQFVDDMQKLSGATAGNEMLISLSTESVSFIGRKCADLNEDLMFDTGVLDSDEMLVEAKIDEKNEQSTKLDDSTASEAVTTAGVDDIKDKGKGIMIEPKVPLKRKDQVALDEQMARDVQAQLEAELIEEEKLARKQEE
ncbi:hypothetical protein Tco_1196319 [Tanacetum coccineum]